MCIVCSTEQGSAELSFSINIFISFSSLLTGTVTAKNTALVAGSKFNSTKSKQGQSKGFIRQFHVPHTGCGARLVIHEVNVLQNTGVWCLLMFPVSSYKCFVSAVVTSDPLFKKP